MKMARRNRALISRAKNRKSRQFQFLTTFLHISNHRGGQRAPGVKVDGIIYRRYQELARDPIEREFLVSIAIGCWPEESPSSLRMGLKAQTVQSIGDLVLVRIYNPPHDELEDNQIIYTTSESEKELERDFSAIVDRSSTREVSSWVLSAARLLQEQWPRQDREKDESTESELGRENDHTDDHAYYRKFLVHHEKSCPSYSLACSYILLQKNSQTPIVVDVVGHGRLTECYESAGGNAVAATYILVDPQYRGKGFGRTLLFLLEREAKSKERLRCDYHFVYLWCKATTAPFYEKSGYRLSKNRVSLQRPCLKSLTATSVQSLEDILLRRRRQPHQDQSDRDGPSPALTKNNNSFGKVTKKLETIMLLPSQSQPNKADGVEQPPVEDDVWLRKRLVDHVESTVVSEEDRKIELQKFVTATNTRTIISNDHSTNKIVVIDHENSKFCYQYHWNPHVPWQMQIGPTCGLTAVRMIRDFYRADESSEQSEAQKDSLLVYAQKRGYTDDGEMFDADQLRDLMKDQLMVTAMEQFIVKTHDTSALTTKEIESTIQKGGLWIIPYDSNPRTKLPGRFRGMHAHWGIVVGILYSRNITAADRNDPEKLDFRNGDGDEYFIVQHSLSLKWAIAPKKTWFDSNRQLISVNEDKFSLGKENKLNLNNKLIQVQPA